MKIISDLHAIQEKFNFDPVLDLLVTNIRLDDYKMVTPLMVEENGKTSLLAREQETGTLEWYGVKKEEIIFYDRYFNFNSVVDGWNTPASLGEVVFNIAQGKTVELELNLPYGRFLEISEKVEVSHPDVSAAVQPVVVHKISKQEVLDRFQALRSGSVEIAERILRSRPHLVELIDELDQIETDTRFEALEAAMQDLGVSSLYSAAPPNISELLGIAPEGDRGVLINSGEDFLYLIRLEADLTAPGNVIGRYASHAEAIRALATSTTVAVEEGWIDLGQALSFQNGGLELVKASKKLSAWREFRDHEDLPFVIILAQTTRNSIETSMAWAKEQVLSGNVITERDIFDYAIAKIADYRQEFEIPYSIEPYFSNLHASNRTNYPGKPVQFPITEETTTVKFDSGFKLKVNGVILATTDMARSIAFNDAGNEAYDFFLEVVRDTITWIRPGVQCDEIHEYLVTKVQDNFDRLIEIGVAPDLENIGKNFIEEYRKRNVGHYMGKQESFATEFRPGHTYKVHEGSVGAVEIQWPYDIYGITAEDHLYVGKTKTFITSS